MRALVGLVAALLPAGATGADLVLESVEVDATAHGLLRAHACPRDVVCFHATTPDAGPEPWVIRDGAAHMLADLRPGPEGSNPSAFMLDGDVAWFSATVAPGRTHLFRYDGERLTLGAIVPDGVSEVLPLPRLGGDVYFVLRGPVDPKDPGRPPVAEIARVGPAGLTRLGVRARIRTFVHDSAEGRGFDGGLWLTGEGDDGRGTLWFFDGRGLSVVHQASDPRGRLERAQVAGPLLVFHELIPSQSGQPPRFLVHVSDGRHVWPVQGFDEGELRFPQEAAALDGTVYITAYRDDVGGELFRLVDDRLELVADIHRGKAASQPGHLTEYDGALWFTARDAQRGFELRRFDGRGVRLVHDFCPGACDGLPAGYRVVGDAMWFFARDGAGTSRAWRLGPARPPRRSPSPVTASGPAPRREPRRVHRAVDLFAPEGSPPALVAVAGAPHFTSFAAAPSGDGWELQPWRVEARDSALVHTRALAPDRVGAAGFLPVGDALWLARTTPSGPRAVPAVAPEGDGVVLPGVAPPRRAAAFGGEALFLADDERGRALFAFDGRHVRRISAAEGDPDAPPGAVVGDVFYFAGRDDVGVELHAWDGRRARRVVDLHPGPGDGMDGRGPATIVGWGADLWFVGTPPGEGAELVRWSPSEGAATPVVVRPGPADGALGPPVLAHDVLWFPGATEATGEEPFVVMSPDAVPRLLVDLNPGRRGSSPTDLTAHAGGVYFAAEVVGLGRELFRVPGREGEVELVRDGAPGPDSSAPRGLVSLGEELWFLARTPEGVALHVFSR